MTKSDRIKAAATKKRQEAEEKAKSTSDDEKSTIPVGRPTPSARQTTKKTTASTTTGNANTPRKSSTAKATTTAKTTNTGSTSEFNPDSTNDEVRAVKKSAGAEQSTSKSNRASDRFPRKVSADVVYKPVTISAEMFENFTRMLAEREQVMANTTAPVPAHHAPAPALLNAADGNTTLPVAHNAPALALLNGAPTTLPTNVARTVRHPHLHLILGAFEWL
jgi:hypothetical protein